MELDLRTIPYNFFGVTLYSVEDRSGFVFFYCDTKEDALIRIHESSKMFDFYYNTKHKEN